MSTSYGEPVTPASPAPVVASPLGEPVAVTPMPAVSTTPPPPEPEPTPVLPATGSVVHYPMYDHYSNPARQREQLVLVTGSITDPATGAVHVQGKVLGFADGTDLAQFRPQDLRYG